MPRARVRTRLASFFPVVLASAALATTARAQSITDCIEDGGRAVCTSQQPGPFSYGLCDEAPAFIFRQAAWCTVYGGTWGGAALGCTGPQTEETEDGLAAHAQKFAELLHGPGCTATDSGWGASFSSFNCFPGGPGFDTGILIKDTRSFSIPCNSGGETIRAIKTRTLSCPAGYVSKGTPRGTSCVRPQEDCEECGVGNPIMPASGVKVEHEFDYIGTGPLLFARHYHSFGFSEPIAGSGEHTENRLGDAWRTNFDKRVIPVAGSVYVSAAVTLPTGEVQYFGPTGDELLNVRGTTTRLVQISTGAASGWVLHGPDGVERYGVDGRLRVIAKASGETLTLTYSDGTGGMGGGFSVDGALMPTTTILPANTLLRVTDVRGHALSFAYDAALRIVAMTDPAGARTVYGYDKLSNLRSVTYPDGAKRTYLYNEPANLGGWTTALHALTGIEDELGARFATFRYTPDGRAVSSEHAGGVGLSQLLYGTNTTTITDAMGRMRTLTFATVDGLLRFKSTSASGGMGYGTGIKDRALDAKGNVSEQTGFNGTKTCFVHEAVRNLETVRVEGLAAATDCTSVVSPGASLPAGARKRSTDWHPRWRAPIRIAGPKVIATFVFNGDTTAAGVASCAPASAVLDDGSASGQPTGVVCERTLQGTSDASGANGFAGPASGSPRTWKQTYNARGKVLTMDGPRTDVPDVTTYAYYPEDDAVVSRRGQLQAIVDALAHATTFVSYDDHGHPLIIRDANGMDSVFTYDARGRVLSTTIAGSPTRYTYDAVGNLARIVLPGGASQDFAYDAAHRVTETADGVGNRLTLAYDAASHVLSTTVYDAASQLAAQQSRELDADGRMVKELDGAGNASLYAYDAVGNVTTMQDASGRQATATYDQLNRLTETLLAGISESKHTYDGRDNVLTITDGRGLVTSNVFDPLSNLTSTSSPDTGTSTFAFDAAGNLTTRTDALGHATQLAYDALNRVTKIVAHDGSVSELSYDVGENGVGRLTQVKDASGTRNLAYYAYGLLAKEEREILLPTGPVKAATVYTYDAADRVSTVRYPSGMVVTYTRDAMGRVTDVTAKIGSSVTTVASGATYSPFGALQSATGTGGAPLAWTWDSSGRLASYGSSTSARTHQYDASGLLTGVSVGGAPLFSYTYDDHGRVGAGSGPMGAVAYAFDEAGNLKHSDVGGKVTDFTFASTSNRLQAATGSTTAAYAYDAAGNMVSDGKRSMSYDALARLVEVKVAGSRVRYLIDVHGQRVGRLVEGP